MRLWNEDRLCDENVFSDEDQDLKDLIFERLMDPTRYETDPATECMIFLGAWTERGVGRVRVGQRVYNVARVAAWLFFGVDLWSDQVAYHRCDCPACFNPDHIGHAPNRSIAYALRRLERIGRKERFPINTGGITPPEKQAIQALAAEGASARELARRFHYTEPEILSVFRVRTNQRGTHVGATRVAA